MFYIIYQITNNINGKIYIGKHQTKNLDDNYMGSGKLLRVAIRKHGQENFTKKILFVFDSEEKMNLKEKELVSEHFCNRSDTYNICVGGQGGFGFINANNLGDKSLAGKKGREKTNLINEINYGPNWRSVLGKKGNNQSALQLALKNKYPNGTFYGKMHSEEAKLKIGLANSKLQDGNRNSQYGTMWITNGYENKKIKIVDDIPEFWYKGRVIKN